ncbi:tetratricopeptide repeat protein [Thioalkalivibrio sp. XN279]|uniref:TPR end-of-group domain-containing protein n=1 Tax=Thioalkalivibrio sp. XN279 TaxID=2714953 RepID=UPI00140D77A4|nr:tetratricopeptide repeat protein [Thioalkalivibrio sp. XN279]NHA15077.1 tetratricopeptide repeat protein [Thioalkalivibrio sp. XN279]
MSLFAELKRRKVIRVAVVYAATAFAVLQGADIMLPRMGVPDWGMNLVVALILLGFPIALVLAWALELTPEGVKRTDDVADAQVAQETTPALLGKRTLLVAGLLVAVGIGLSAGWWLKPGTDDPQGPVAGGPTPPAAPEAPAENPVAAAGGESASPSVAREDGLIAVLPFRNRSVREEDAFFAEGIHDDLLTQLSKIGSLKVISRTSMMRYADTDKSVPEIARELGAAVVLEGAVQRAGEHVRVTVQLIDGASDVHLWAESYDRELTTETIFAIQADIGQAVANAMQVVLSPEETDALRAGSTRNLQAYEAFLRGKLLSGYSGISSETSRQAIAEFDRAIALDPEFAEAYARKADIQLVSFWLAVGPRSLREDARKSVAEAKRLAPDSIETRLAEARQYYFAQLDFASADRILQGILAEVPDHAEAWESSAYVARRDGRFDDAIFAFERALAINPQAVDVINSMVETTAQARGDFAAAAAWLERAERLGGDTRIREIWLHEWQGDVEAAWAAIDGPLPNFVDTPARIAIFSRDAERIESALSPALWPEDQRSPGDFPETYAMARAWALLVMGRQAEADRLLAEIKDRMDQRSDPYPSRWLGNAYYQPVDLPGLMGDLEGVRAAEADFLANAPRDVWGLHSILPRLAGAFARAGDPDRAVHYLEQQVEIFGPHRFLLFAIDPDFDSLREHPRYLALQARYQAWAEAQTNE